MKESRNNHIAFFFHWCFGGLAVWRSSTSFLLMPCGTGSGSGGSWLRSRAWTYHQRTSWCGVSCPSSNYPVTTVRNGAGRTLYCCLLAHTSLPLRLLGGNKPARFVAQMPLKKCNNKQQHTFFVTCSVFCLLSSCPHNVLVLITEFGCI